jgi:hypothetical protein
MSQLKDFNFRAETALQAFTKFPISDVLPISKCMGAKDRLKCYSGDVIN